MSWTNLTLYYTQHVETRRSRSAKVLHESPCKPLHCSQWRRTIMVLCQPTAAIALDIVPIAWMSPPAPVGGYILYQSIKISCPNCPVLTKKSVPWPFTLPACKLIIKTFKEDHGVHGTGVTKLFCEIWLDQVCKRNGWNNMPSACMSKIAKDSSKGFFFNQTKSKLAQDEVVFALEDPVETTHKSCSLSQHLMDRSVRGVRKVMSWEIIILMDCDMG